MRKTIITALVILFLLAIAASSDQFGITFGRTDYWQMHGAFLLVFLALFPRLTLLFSSIPFGGILWWLGFIFFPRFLIAMLATFAYGATNPLLVLAAWLVALAGEKSEKHIIRRRVIRFESRGRREDNVIDV